MSNLILCGFMGSGKTSLAQVFSKMTGQQFIDTDMLIEQSEQMTIPQIFEKHGEEYFRKLELNLAMILSTNNNCVIATGGGFLLHDSIDEIMRKTGDILFIDCDFEDCYQRIKDSERPLVKQKSKEELLALFNERRPKYLAICTERIDPNGLPQQ